jgi:hypothetical protein
VVESRPVGGAYVLDALWQRLGVAEAVACAIGARRFQQAMDQFAG